MQENVLKSPDFVVVHSGGQWGEVSLTSTGPDAGARRVHQGATRCDSSRVERRPSALAEPNSSTS